MQFMLTTLFISMLLVGVHELAVLAESRLDGTHAFLDLLLFREPHRKRCVLIFSVNDLHPLPPPTASPGFLSL